METVWDASIPVARELIRLYYDIQKLRVATNNRYKVRRFSVCPRRHYVPLKSGSREGCPVKGCGMPVKVVEKPSNPVLESVLKRLEVDEENVKAALYDAIKDHPLWTMYLSRIRGIGPVLAAYLIFELDPRRFESVSKLWHYCGLHVVDGKAPRRAAGQKVDWNPFARTMAWRMSDSFRKVGGFYKMFYEMKLSECTQKHPDWTKKHCIAHAMRVTVKLFLSHYHEIGRAIYGFPAVTPYSCIVKPHECIPPVVDYDNPEGKITFYETFLAHRYDRRLYEYWSNLFEQWLKIKEEEAAKQQQEQQQQQQQ
jgi:hypothetical protein